MARLYRQAAVIPFRIRDERVEIALLTTLSGKRWVLPKGSLADGERAPDATIRETVEEGRSIPADFCRLFKQNTSIGDSQ